jgi:hypothetical protein
VALAQNSEENDHEIIPDISARSGEAHPIKVSKKSIQTVPDDHSRWNKTGLGRM